MDDPQTDLAFSPEDPLNMLLHASPRDEDSNSSAHDSISDEQSLSDWSSLWSFPGQTKLDENQYLTNLPPSIDFDSPFGKLDYNAAMAVDPNVLHPSYVIPPSALDTASSDVFPFTFQAPTSTSERRLSVGSSSGSSASSPSPSVEASSRASVDDSAAQLALRVREASGLVYANPTSSALQSHGLTISFPEQVFHHAKLDDNSSASSSSSAASTPPPTTPPLSHVLPHDVIELISIHAFHALRMAVPALRVLEEKEASVGGPGKKGGKGKLSGRVGVIKQTAPADGDVVDERGFIDGVKVARKVSKANVLGKAVEYIRVLKKRETRLRREQEGLKELICGLVGGPALVQKWEHEWRAYRRARALMLEAEDGSDDDADSDEENGRKRKKVKTEPTAPKIPADKSSSGSASSNGSQPEKRKRGRPRKNPLPSAAPPATAPIQSGHPTHLNTAQVPGILNANTLMNMAMEVDPNVMSAFVQPPPQSSAPQYMMATFALFSFFNSPIHHIYHFRVTPFARYYSSTGHVLTAPKAAGFDLSSLTWNDSRSSLPPPRISPRLHEHCTAMGSIAVLKFIEPTQALTPLLNCSSRIASVLTASLLDSVRGAEDEAARLRIALGTVPDGLLSQVTRITSLFASHSGEEHRYEHRSLTQRAWVRLGELAVLADEDSVSNYSRLYTYYQIRVHLPWFGASAGDLATMALLLWPVSFARNQSRALWDSASQRCQREHERLVFENMDPQRALSTLQTVRREQLRQWTPMGILGRIIIEERIKKHLRILFVLGSQTIQDDQTMISFDLDLDVEEERREVKRTVEAALSLGGRHLRALGDCLNRVANGQDDTSFDDFILSSSSSPISSRDVDGEIKVFLTALVLYRRIFPTLQSSSDVVPSILVSPPQTGNKKMEMRLRIMLGDEAFDSDFVQQKDEALGMAVDEARERIVSLLEDKQRRL
ncbi:hypothetical protein DL96DRAFT_1783553 [Flagelloscypha sp. PMI_526]|nr:hypothetical protein DL96DRAFT_1783553 [Flagelloscypha sp. PMI_526]